MSNLKHIYEVREKINQIKQGLKLKDENILILNYCLGCQRQFKVYRSEIQNIGSVNLYIDKLTREKYLHCLCNKCTEKFANPYNKKALTELDNNICKEISKFHPEILSE